MERKPKVESEVKVATVEDYLASNGSLMDISQNYGLRSKAQLLTWIIKYNGHEEIKSPGTGGDPFMTQRRTTTLEERIEIVRYCIENDKNYNETGRCIDNGPMEGFWAVLKSEMFHQNNL